MLKSDKIRLEFLERKVVAGWGIGWHMDWNSGS